VNIWRVPYPKFGDGPGLERVRAVATHLRIDLAMFGVHGAVIVGSNGKGSTAAMTASLLRQSGASVGLFTSPHLFALNERFNIDGDDISDDELGVHWARVASAIDAAGLASKAGGFEFLFLIAASWFAARGCAHTVWEAGIGGRLDPVRLIEARRLALTSLDLEHTQLLGNTLEEIARDKIDAAPDGATLFVGASCAPTRTAIEAHCGARGVQCVFGPALAPFHAPFAGSHQNENAALAIALARNVTALTDAQVEAGLAAAHWPGRLEILQRDPLIVIDVGHTPAAIAVALEGFEVLQGARPGVLICGASRDKDARAMIATLAPAFANIVCAAAQHKGAPASEIAAAAAAANPAAEITVADSIAEARRVALAKAHTEGAIYVAGGLFVAAEFRAIHLGRDPASLAFF
jgi:dihydrofolate synthase/folylpolyglutamate synthase